MYFVCGSKHLLGCIALYFKTVVKDCNKSRQFIFVVYF